MKRFIAALASGVLALLFLPVLVEPVAAAWKRVEVGGKSICENDETGDRVAFTYVAKSNVTMLCNALNQVEQWLGGTLAEAQLSLRMPQAAPPPPAGWVTGEYFATSNPVHSSGSATYGLALPGPIEVFNVSSVDGRFYFTEDTGSVWLYSLDPAQDFTLTAQVTTLNLGSSVKAFVGVRAANAADSIRVGMEKTPDNWVVAVRPTTAGATDLPVQTASAAAAPFCLRISNDGSMDSILTEYSEDDDCTTASYTTAGQFFNSAFSTGDAKFLEIGCASVNPNPGTLCGVTFNEAFVVVDQGAVTHPSGQATVGFSPTSFTFDESDGTVSLPVVLSGTNAAGCTINANTVNGSAIGGTDFTSFSNQVLTWAAAATGTRNVSLAITNRSGVQQGDTQLTVVLNKATCVDPTLINATGTVAINDEDATPDTGITFSALSEARATFTGGTAAQNDANTLNAEWGDAAIGEDGQGQMCWPADSSTCNHPQVYFYSQNDSANGGPASPCEGSWFMRLKRTTAQAPMHWGNATNGNRVGVNVPGRVNTTFAMQREQAWDGFCLYIPSSANGWDTSAMGSEATSDGCTVTGTYPGNDNEILNTWSFLWGYHGIHSLEPTYLMFVLTHCTAAGESRLHIQSRTSTADFHGGTIPWDEISYTLHYNAVPLRGQWIRYEISHTPDERTSGGVGQIGVWQNGTQIVNYTGPVGFGGSGNHAAGDVTGYAYLMSYMSGSNPFNRQYWIDDYRHGDDTSDRLSVSADPSD